MSIPLGEKTLAAVRVPLDQLAANLDPGNEGLESGQQHRAARYLLALPRERPGPVRERRCRQPDELPGHSSLMLPSIPQVAAGWSLQAVVADDLARERLIKNSCRIVRDSRYVVFQLAEVAVPRALFADILRRIDDLRPRLPPLPA